MKTLLVYLFITFGFAFHHATQNNIATKQVSNAPIIKIEKKSTSFKAVFDDFPSIETFIGNIVLVNCITLASN